MVVGNWDLLGFWALPKTCLKFEDVSKRFSQLVFFLHIGIKNAYIFTVDILTTHDFD